ncbi:MULTISPECIES: hypothetical protein [Brevibacterium]|uniref:Uncharacterized protein n=1 Tax=Brevibacterium pityocampae TaxID=506594 RepID=A0ABP8JEQ3_9MICO|nr:MULTISPECIES: hypothetical protein [Brevibacterium]
MGCGSSTADSSSAHPRTPAEGTADRHGTHSPILARADNAKIVEVGDWGLRECRWENLDMVDHWRRFLHDPQRYLRYLDD